MELEKHYIGTDFVKSAVDLINAVGDRFDRKISGHLFNMLEPDYEFRVPANFGVLTFGSLEQLASKIDDVFEYFINCGGVRFVHIEPCIELYDRSKLPDYLAATFQGNRGYTENLLKKLTGLERQGRIKITKIRRLGFGSMMMEGYNLFVWEYV